MKLFSERNERLDPLKEGETVNQKVILFKN